MGDKGKLKLLSALHKPTIVTKFVPQTNQLKGWTNPINRVSSVHTMFFIVRLAHQTLFKLK